VAARVWEQAKALGQNVIDAIEYGVTAYVDFVTWVWETIGQPIANEIAAYIGSGQLWDDLVALGSHVSGRAGMGPDCAY